MSRRLSIIIRMIPVCMYVLSGVTLARQADALALNSPVFEPIVNGRMVNIEVVLVNGQEPCGNSLREAVELFGRYVAGEVRIIEARKVDIEGAALSRGQFDQICNGRRFAGPSDIILITASDIEFFKGRGEYAYETTTKDSACSSVKINTAAVGRDARRFGFTSLEAFWRTIILHELCHTLNVPSDKSHIWSGSHCTNPECVLYPDFDADSFSVARCLGLPTTLCAVCEGEVRAAQKRANGQFYDASVPYDHFQRIVDVNPDNPEAQVYRVFKSLNQKDYGKALADCTQLIELDPSRVLASVNDGTTGYGLRGMIYNNYLGDPERAVADFTRALAINPGEPTSAKALRQILAARPDLGEHARTVAAAVN